MSDDIAIKFGAEIAGLKAGTDQAKHAIEGVKESVDKISEGFKHIAELVGIAFSIEGIIKFTEKMGDLGLQTERTMAMLGIGAERVGVLSGIATLTGTSMDGLTTSIERMSLNIQKSTADAFNPAAQGLKVLGLNAKDLIGLPADQYFSKLADAVSKFNPSLNLTNALMAVGGRGVAQMLPALQLGSEGFKKFEEEIKRAQEGLAGSVPGMAATHEKLSLLSISVQSLGARIFTVLKPAIDGAIAWMTRFVQSIKSEDIVAAFRIVGDVLIGITDAVGRFAIYVTSLWDELKATVGGSASLFAAAFNAMSGNMVGAVKNILEAWNSQRGMSDTADRTAAAYERLNAFVVSLRAALKGAADESARVLSGAAGHGDVHKPEAGAMDETARDRLEAALKLADGQVKAAQSAFERTRIIYDQDASLFKITQDQKFALLQDALLKEYNAELSAVNSKLALMGLTKAQHQEIMNQRRAIEDKYSKEVLRLNQESVKSMQQNWQEGLGSITTAFNSQLRGLLAGTTSFAQAFKSIMGDLLIKLIEVIEQMGVKWAAGQLAELTATQSGAAAKAAAEVAGQEASLPVRIAKFESDLLAAASIGAANAYAALAAFPPAAAAAAAAAFAGITELGQVGVPKLDVGTPMVLSDGLAMLHKGEQVLTAAQVAAPGSGAGGGNRTVHVHTHLSAWDANSVDRWLKNGGERMIAKAVSRAFDENPSLRASY